MVARLIAWMSGVRRGRMPMALLALVAGLALAIGGGPGDSIAHTGGTGASAQAHAATPDVTTAKAAAIADPTTSPDQAPALPHLGCAGHCATHLADLPTPSEGVVTGRVEAADWPLAPSALADPANPEGLERPPRV